MSLEISIEVEEGLKSSEDYGPTLYRNLVSPSYSKKEQVLNIISGIQPSQATTIPSRLAYV